MFLSRYQYICVNVIDRSYYKYYILLYKQSSLNLSYDWLSTNTSATWLQMIETLQSPAVRLSVVAADVKKAINR